MSDRQEEELAGMRAGGAKQFRIEKFFVDCEETFQSQTMCFLKLPEVQTAREPFADRQESIVMYEVS